MGENGSGLPGRHVQVFFYIAIRIQGIQRRGDGKDCAPSLPPKKWEGEVGEPRNLFSSTWRWVRFCTWGRLEPALGGNRRGGYRLVSPAEVASTLLLRFLKFIACRVHVWIDMRVQLHVCTTTTSTTTSTTTTTAVSLTGCTIWGDFCETLADDLCGG